MDPIIFFNLYLPIIITSVGLLFGMTIGRIIEWTHYFSIRRREKKLKNILVFSTRFPPEHSKNGQLVMGSVTIAEDGFKTLLAVIRKFFGGNIGSYEALLDRARREAILRMKAKAKADGKNMIVNVKFTTATIRIVAVEVLAFGTAIDYDPGV